MIAPLKVRSAMKVGGVSRIRDLGPYRWHDAGKPTADCIDHPLAETLTARPGRLRNVDRRAAM
jgi:hypothetical protein